MRAGLSRRRFLKGGAAAAFAAGVPMLNFGSFQAFAVTPRKYSARAVKIVERSLVIDMLGVLKIDFTPEAYASPMS
ncbi:MAG: twin-arginine translocation signal domain-containing protein, partial [Steroidobacterales bacterium]